MKSKATTLKRKIVRYEHSPSFSFPFLPLSLVCSFLFLLGVHLSFLWILFLNYFRKATVVSGGNRTTSSPASSNRIKAVGSSTTAIPLTNVDLEPKPVCAIGSVTSPSLNISVNDNMGSKSAGSSSVHLLPNASIGDKFEGNIGSSTAPILNVVGKTGSNSDGPIYPRSTYDNSTDICAPPSSGNSASQHTSGILW